MKLNLINPRMVATCAIALAFSFVVPSAIADDNKKLASAVKESAMANDFPKFIKPFRKVRGKREHAVKWWASADADPVECTGTSDAKWTHENRVISQKFKGLWLRTNFEATFVFGYDNTLGLYTCSWVDTLANRIIFFSGKPEKDSKQVTFTAQTADALTREPVSLRCVMQLPDRKGQIKTEFFRTDTGGNEYKFMEVVSKKKVIRAG